MMITYIKKLYRKWKYPMLEIYHYNSDMDIWLSDKDGFLVMKSLGKLKTRLMRGVYYVEFGLGNKKHKMIFWKSTKISIIIKNDKLEVLKYE